MNNKMKPFLFLPVFALAACASKGDFIVVQDDVQKLKTEAETIKSQSAVSYSDVQQVRDEVSRLRGDIEESNHKNSKSLSRLGIEDSLLVHQVGDLESRLLKIEQYLGIGKGLILSTATSPEQKDSVAVAKTPGKLSDAALLKAGVESLAKKKYVAARESFNALLKSYPKSVAVDSAQFLIAESYFSEQWYEKAILEYQVVIAKFLISTKRPAALYKQARSFEMIDDLVNAKARYKDLINVYPASPEAGLAKKRLKLPELRRA